MNKRHLQWTGNSKSRYRARQSYDRKNYMSYVDRLNHEDYCDCEDETPKDKTETHQDSDNN